MSLRAPSRICPVSPPGAAGEGVGGLFPPVMMSSNHSGGVASWMDSGSREGRHA